MNREIKFRAWDKINKQFIPNKHLSVSIKNIGNSDQFILEQYTGIKDKSGVEIYCGDKLTTHRHDNIEDKIDGHVRFEHGAFVIGEGSISLYALWLADDVFEVIGNIHEENYNG